MGRILKALFVLAVLGLAGLTGYAYFGNMAPEQTEITQPVTLDAD
jgi:predicted negative regulator of RcsB-dependent stress response